MAIIFSDGTQSKRAHSGRTLYWDYSTVADYNNQNSHVDLPGILGNGTPSITPRSTSSKILVECGVHMGHETTWRSINIKVFRRIGTGSWIERFGFSGGQYFTNNVLGTSQARTFLDSPGTTSAVSYKGMWRGHSQGGDLHLNQSNFSNSTSNNREGGETSYFRLTEILD